MTATPREIADRALLISARSGEPLTLVAVRQALFALGWALRITGAGPLAGYWLPPGISLLDVKAMAEGGFAARRILEPEALDAVGHSEAAELLRAVLQELEPVRREQNAADEAAGAKEAD